MPPLFIHFIFHFMPIFFSFVFMSIHSKFILISFIFDYSQGEIFRKKSIATIIKISNGTFTWIGTFIIKGFDQDIFVLDFLALSKIALNEFLKMRQLIGSIGFLIFINIQNTIIVYTGCLRTYGEFFNAK